MSQIFTSSEMKGIPSSYGFFIIFVWGVKSENHKERGLKNREKNTKMAQITTARANQAALGVITPPKPVPGTPRGDGDVPATSQKRARNNCLP